MNRLFYRAAAAVLAPFRYAEREVAHMKEVAKEDMQAMIVKVIKFAIMGVAGLFFLGFLSSMVAKWINSSMDSEFAGQGIVAGFYLIIAVVMFALKDTSEKKKNEARAAREEETKRRALGVDGENGVQVVRKREYQFKGNTRRSVGSND